MELAQKHVKIRDLRTYVPAILDVFCTEETIKNGFKSVFKARCDVIAQMIYLRASKNLEACRLTINDVYKVMAPFLHENPIVRLKAVFEFLCGSTDCKEINIVTLIQLLHRLADRTILKFEVHILLKEFRRQLKQLNNPSKASINF